MSDKCWRRLDIDPLGVRQHAQHIEGWLGGQCVVNLPRARPAQGPRVGRCIDYRHLVGALKRKPGAFARRVLRDAAFPHAVYRQTWERLAAQKPEREACRAMVGLLVLAADGHEAQLAQELKQLIELDQLPDLGALTQLLAPPNGDVPQVVVTLPTLSTAQVMALAQGTEWIDRGANVLLFGPPGVGKSHLGSALGLGLIDAGRRVLFKRCSDLVQRLQAARRNLRLPQELAKLDRFDVLIPDALSYVRRDQAETSALFELISERYERKSLAITANTPFSQWGEVFVEPAMTLAAVDRLWCITRPFWR